MLHILQETQHVYMLKNKLHNYKIREANLKEPINMKDVCKAGLVLISIVSHQRRAVNASPPMD